jgi:RNase adapter protein RapZ
VSVLHLVVVTGMSGAGRSTALKALEDLGFFCVDNIPPALIPQLVTLLADTRELTRIGLGMDVRTGAFLVGAEEVLDGLIKSGHEAEIIFLECNDNELVRRYSETRRSHPLAPGGDILKAIQRERERVAPLRLRARFVLDTSGLSVHDLRRLLVDYIARGGARPRMVTRVISFGFKYGIPVDADLVFDLRYLPNPYFVRELRSLSGLSPQVAQFVNNAPESQELLEDLEHMLRRMLPRYEREGKAYLTIALGCTGGRHRSVSMAEELARRLGTDREIIVSHRDLDEDLKKQAK